MPALPSVPKVLRARIFTHMQEDLASAFHLYLSYSGTAPSNTDCDNFATAVHNAFQANLAPLMTSNYTQDQVTIEDLSSSTASVGVDSTPILGGLGGLQVAANVATQITFDIARRYRGGKPKVFLPLGTATEMNDAQTWGAIYNGLVQAAWAAFIAAVEAAGWSGAGTIAHVAVSYYQGNLPVENPITHRWRNIPTLRGTPLIDAVVGYFVPTRIASQRRRL